MTLEELVDRRQPFAVSVCEAPSLAGCKKAVWDGRRLYASPALWSLLDDPEGMDDLARAVEVVEIPEGRELADEPLFALGPLGEPVVV